MTTHRPPADKDKDEPAVAQPSVEERLSALEAVLLAPDSEHVRHHARLAASDY